MQPTEAELLGANEAFYRAFAVRDYGAMETLWARRAPVACIHPGWGILQGRDEVMASWRAILGNPTQQDVVCSGANAYVLGELSFVVCIESIEGSELVATNVFTREDGEWKLVHHHAGPVVQRKPLAQRARGGMLN